MEIEVLLLDVGGTAFDWRTAVASSVRRARFYSPDRVDAEAFGAEWRKQSLVEIEKIASEAAPWRAFDAVLLSSLQHTFSAFGIEEASEHDRRMLFKAWEAMPVWPEVPEAIARLRRRYLVAPHTILSLRAAAFSSRKAGVSWDAIISCDGLRATKPHPMSYARALDALGRPAERVCFVAAHPSDLRAARARGMKTAYVRARLEDYGDSYEDTGFAAEFDVMADDFAHLADCLGA